MVDRWYVAETRPCAERRAVLHLVEQGFKPFLPTCVVRRRIRRQLVSVVLPLFPRYLMIPLDLANENWKSVKGTPGVKRLMGTDPQCPIAVPPREMDQIFLLCRDGPVDGRLAVGKIVRIIQGALQDFHGRVVGRSNNGEIQVLTALLFAREAVYSIREDWIEAI